MILPAIGTFKALAWLAPMLLAGPHGPGSGAADLRFQSLDSAVVSGIRRGTYSGAVVVVGTSTGVLHARGFGRLAPGARRIPSADSTLFDLASLTKVVATTSAAMVLVDRQQLDLDAPVVHYLPQFNSPAQRRITVRMLLNHTRGLRPYGQFFRLAANRRQAIDLLLREQPERTPGSSPVYSDINAMLLGLIVERISGKALDYFARDEVFTPLGMTSTRFVPPRSWWSRTAASSVEHGKAVAGTVQDRKARILGGIAGHAGLFATGADLARFAQWWLAHGVAADGTRIVAETTMTAFLAHQAEAGTRLLGWDSPDLAAEGATIYGSLISDEAYGHTGWTGTQIWVDPERDLFVVLLTNRSLNPRVNRSIRDLREIRARVADAAVTAVEPHADPLSLDQRHSRQP
jgi:CubicO group peptidase (beta-lactamase class C family)